MLLVAKLSAERKHRRQPLKNLHIRLPIICFGAVLTAVGGEIWFLGAPEGFWSFGLLGCACVAGGVVVSDIAVGKFTELLASLG